MKTVYVLLSSELSAETASECAMIAREQRARQRALASILCERAAVYFNESLTQQFVAEFCLSVVQDVYRFVFHEYFHMLLMMTVIIVVVNN